LSKNENGLDPYEMGLQKRKTMHTIFDEEEMGKSS
jgi:hypothetical protein